MNNTSQEFQRPPMKGALKNGRGLQAYCSCLPCDFCEISRTGCSQKKLGITAPGDKCDSNGPTDQM